MPITRPVRAPVPSPSRTIGDDGRIEDDETGVEHELSARGALEIDDGLVAMVEWGDLSYQPTESVSGR